jgi:hypothetical protein
MKKTILIAALSILTLTGIFGQLVTITAPLTVSQDTVCVGGQITLQGQLQYAGATTPQTVVGCYKIQFGNSLVSNPTIIGTSATYTITIPTGGTTALVSVVGTIPTGLSNGQYNIRMSFYSNCNTVGGGYSPSFPYHVYAVNPPSIPTIS